MHVHGTHTTFIIPSAVMHLHTPLCTHMHTHTHTHQQTIHTSVRTRLQSTLPQSNVHKSNLHKSNNYQVEGLFSPLLFTFSCFYSLISWIFYFFQSQQIRLRQSWLYLFLSRAKNRTVPLHFRAYSLFQLFHPSHFPLLNSILSIVLANPKPTSLKSSLLNHSQYVISCTRHLQCVPEKRKPVNQVNFSENCNDLSETLHCYKIQFIRFLLTPDTRCIGHAWSSMNHFKWWRQNWFAQSGRLRA